MEHSGSHDFSVNTIYQLFKYAKRTLYNIRVTVDGSFSSEKIMNFFSTTKQFSGTNIIQLLLFNTTGHNTY